MGICEIPSEFGGVLSNDFTEVSQWFVEPYRSVMLSTSVSVFLKSTPGLL